MFFGSTLADLKCLPNLKNYPSLDLQYKCDDKTLFNFTIEIFDILVQGKTIVINCHNNGVIDFTKIEESVCKITCPEQKTDLTNSAQISLDLGTNSGR